MRAPPEKSRRKSRFRAPPDFSAAGRAGKCAPPDLVDGGMSVLRFHDGHKKGAWTAIVQAPFYFFWWVD